MDLYELKFSFAKSIGFKSCSDAIKNLGKAEFNNRFEESNTKPINPVYDGVGKTLMFDDNYIIYPDGRLWTIHNQMFLVPIKRDKYCVYILRGRKTFNASKLVWLHFANSSKKEYKNIRTMIHKNGNYCDFSIENLEEKQPEKIFIRKHKDKPDRFIFK